MNTCCEGSRGFPSAAANEAWLRRVAEAGGNWVHVRMGPFHPESEGGLWSDAVAYRDDGTWNDDFFRSRRARCEYAASLGIYYEITALDGWLMRHADLGDAYNWWREGASVTRHAPQRHHIKWLEKLAWEFGGYPNVIWSTGNELFLCNPSNAWDRGVAEVLKGTGRLVGSNIHRAAPWADFDIWHTQRLSDVPAWDRAQEVNEYHASVSVAAWTDLATEGARRGIPVHGWPQGWHDDQIALAFSRLRELRELQEAA
jgi:hypothetical protein